MVVSPVSADTSPRMSRRRRRLLLVSLPRGLALLTGIGCTAGLVEVYDGPVNAGS
jgi:hypothetical protein